MHVAYSASLSSERLNQLRASAIDSSDAKMCGPRRQRHVVHGMQPTERQVRLNFGDDVKDVEADQYARQTLQDVAKDYLLSLGVHEQDVAMFLERRRDLSIGMPSEIGDDTTANQAHIQLSQTGDRNVWVFSGKYRAEEPKPHSLQTYAGQSSYNLRCFALSGP